jgi:hypothetical protein
MEESKVAGYVLRVASFKIVRLVIVHAGKLNLVIMCH